MVAAAEGKQTEAENALTEANKDGAINQTEHDDLTGKNQAVTEAKTPAQAAVDALPDGQEKSELQNRLDAVDGITVPAVNDQDGNGKPDDQDAALKQAQDLVAAAEGKQTEAENALTEANKDGAINQTEHDDLTGKNQAVTEAKTPAQAAVDALPDGQEKSELQNRLDAVDGITVPAVNDQDGNGKPDDQDAALKQAQDLVAAAEGKQTEAENALTEANKDGAINQTEHDDLTGKNQAVTEAKTPAQAAVDALPDGQEKSELQNRLDAVDGITVPAVNDQDGNGKPDDQDAALKQAQDLVAAAEGKQTEAENALTEANKDGAINQTEHDDLTGKNQAVTEAKTPAQAAVDALPDGQEKSELQNRLDAVDGITVPAVNDQDGNGKPDDQDAALKQAQDLVAAAEGKQTEAENALTEANKDGAINQTEHDDLTGKNQAVTEAKTPAQAAVDALPDGQEKSELQNRLDAVDGITVPAVNDQDGNGKPDDQDAALKQAQDLVAAAEGKQTEAENALTEANKDGAINQTEHDDLTGKNQAVTEAKTPAQAAVDALPDGQEKSELQNRLDAVDGITVPAVNDQDGNGKPDDQDAALKQAQDLVAAAEGKQTEAENALTEANKDGAINQTEHDDLTGKNQAVTEAKTPAQAAVDALPDGQEKSELQNRLDAVDGITVPAVNDQDGNGKPDDQDAALKQAQDLVAAAEGKQTEAENALTEANKDGAINQTEHDDLTGKNQAVTEAKTPAQAAVDALPDGQEKSELQNRLDAVDGITVPAVNDQDGNGKPDDQDAALKQAQDLVAAAEGKQTEAENALTEANKDGAINQTEHDDLTGKNQAVTEAKTPAQAAVDALPDGQEKSELQNRLDAVDGITVPAVNDQDGNGKPDDQDAALKQAQDLVAAAEGKQTEAENALTEANKDGAINQTEHDDLTGKNQAVTEAKTPAQAAVDALPDGQEKSELQNRLDAVDGITVPAVNDQDGNGKPDDQDAALKQAQDLVAAAEGKQTEAENALTEANKDGAINQTEHDDLTGKNQAVTEAKTPAQAAVDALPDGQEKSELQNRLDAVDGITVPAVNDQDGNGKPDDQDAALKQAQDLVAAAEGKQTEAENALTEANKDGAINQTEHDDLTGKNQAVTEAKTPAQAAVDALPDGQEKSELQNRLDAVDGITVPAVNDQDGNGKPDDQDAALKQAQDLVAAAEGKQTEAENALTEANKDGAINQTEHDDLTGKNQAVTEAKTPAQAAVDALPDGQEKSELQNRLDAVDGITVPAVNDQDGNGKPDDQDAALKQAQDLVAAAEGKQTEAENALTEANKDGAINQTEHDDLTGKNQAVTEAKTPAQAAVDALPDGQEKSELQNRLDAVDGITVPAVNDQDGNGKPDDQDAALKQAQDLVAAAEGKQTEAENALTEANKDGAINQTEHDDLTGKNQAVTEAKTPAQAAVDALPDGQEKSELQNRLDAVDGITVPAVNDQDGNGKPDDQDAALKQAQDLVAAAEGKQTEAENALTEANKDGAINQTEHDDLTGKNQAVTEAKTPAQAAVDALPDGQEKSELQNRLDAVDGITVPAVNDQDGNGKPDDQDAALKQAQDLVAAAEGKQTEAENALTEANKDGAINQTEHDDLTGKNQAVTEAKTPAQAAVDALPDGQEKSELQNRLDAVDGITVPAVNDQDGNGKPDDQDAALKQAQDLVAAAEGKQTEAENALTEANKDGAINQTEHDDLTGKNQAVTEAKTPAQAAVDALPDGQEKSELQNRLDAVDGITVPAVNDQDGNGKPDDQDAALKQAQDLVAAAEGKQTEAENALTEANKDGAINQTEHDDLTGKNQAVTEAKTPAQAAVDALPDGQEKSELQNRLDAVDGITVPAVNDQDGNGKPDDQDAALKQAQDLVAAAEGKQTEAENALTEANKDGAINQTEHDDLTGKNQAVTEAKTPAQAAVDALPDGQEKSELQNRLDAVDGITVPAVNDQDGNGKPDDQDAALKQAQDLVAAAEGKQTEAENALTEANKDGAINQTEHDDLTGKNQAVTEAKTPAQAAVDALPDGQEKSELQNRLDAVDGITVPAVNDQDGNGKPDDQDAALKQAQDLVAAAEGKQTEAENALTEANKDGAINQTEHDDLTGKNQAVTEAKTPAQAAVDALPDGQEKSELQNRLDAVDGITVPAVNDQDGNGKPDDQDAALKQAQDLVAAAEGKQTEAENALTEANKDGAINQTEHDDLTGKNQAVTEAKTPAQAAVDALPDGQEKSELQNRLDAVDGITVPAVNDQDGNGKPDDQDQQEAFNNAKAHLEKALNTVYQPNDDLYAVYKSAFNKPAGNPEASTTSWREVLNQNGVSGFSADKGHDGAYRYTYNGLDGDDVISTAYSVGGTGRTMISRNDMVINTNGGDDIISVGMDYGRSYSAGYTDKKYYTDMGAGDDIMMIGLGNNKVGVHLRDDLSLRIVDRDDNINNGELLLPVSQYDKGTGGIISSTSINMGDGNDTLLAFGYEGFGKAIVNTNIDLGAGNDIIHVNGDVDAVNIKGGAGMDTLAISHGTISTTDFSGFEVIELGDNNGGINVIASALVHSGVDAIEGGILKITGTSNTRVNLDGNDWKSGGALSEDGVNYNVYTHDAAPDIKILIDEHITNVV
ncbi:GA-like domain-containing protein [Escherichia coli]|uniref:GA-like domain-containing protein n=4 Tax=Escherichia coli TaxID=562 RepID=UPI003CC7FA44